MAAGQWNMQKASGGVASITIADGVGDTNIVLPESGTVATEQYVDGKYSGFKNYIINGNFDIWQYGTSQTTNGYGSDDRWLNANTGGLSKTHLRVACTDTERALFNAAYFSRTNISSYGGVSDYCVKYQKIEDVTTLAGKTVTLSFWAKADTNKKLGLIWIQNFGSGGNPSAENAEAGQLFNITSTWTKYTTQYTFPSIVGKTLGTNGVHTSASRLDFWMSSVAGSLVGQQSGTFDIAQVQLEEGSIATPFEQRPYGLELSLCQRYYEKGLAAAVSYASAGAAYQRGYVSYSTGKRSAPSVILTKNAGEATGGGVTIGDSTGFIFGYSSTGASQEWVGTYTADAEL